MEAVESAVAGGVDAVQLRENDLPGREVLNLARDLRTVTSRAGVPLIINDRIDVALAVKAHGVHLGAGSIPIGDARRLLPPGGLIGYSAHSAAEAEGAVLAGADYVFLAPVFDPGSKPATRPALGTDVLWRIAAACPIPVYALGGITPERLGRLMRPPAGAGRAPAGAAFISAVLDADDPAEQATAFRQVLEGPA